MSESNSDGNNNNNSENNMGGFEGSFAVMLNRLTHKMIANGVNSAGAFRDRAEELRNFIDAGNPEQPFDFFFSRRPRPRCGTI